MKNRSQWLLTSTVALGLLALPALATGATYYVDTVGDDSGGTNDCSVEATPCKTITHAATQLIGGVDGAPNVLMVAAGTYDETTNGETYPVTFSQGNISLKGSTTETSTVDAYRVENDGSVEDGLVFLGRNVSVSDFTFVNAEFAIEIGGTRKILGGYTISNNIFRDSVATGVDSGLYNDSDTTSFTVNPISITDNIFESNGYGVNFKIGMSFDGSTTGLVATVGNITVTGNSFTGMSSDGFYFKELYISEMDSGTATVGTITFTDNTFTDCYNGLNLGEDRLTFKNFFYVKYMDNSTVTLGNVSVSNNIFTDNSRNALYVDYFDVSYLNGSSTAILGDLTVHHNTIEADTKPASGYGIYIYDIGHIIELYDNAKVTTGTVAITDNIVESNDYALYVNNYGVYYIGTEGGTDTVTVDFGPMTISGNDLSSSNNHATYLDIDYFGYDQYAQTSVDVGLITVHDNDMTALGGATALYFYYYYESGYSMDDDAELIIAGLTFTDNRISSASSYGIFFDLYELAYDMDGNSKMSVGPTIFTGNSIQSDDEALYLYFTEVAYYMYDSASFTMDPWTISNNTLTSNGSPSEAALTIYYYDYCIGSSMEDNSSATLPDWNISNNKIDVKGGYDGIYYYTYGNPYYNYDNAAVHYGNMMISNNIINENKDPGLDTGISLYLDDVCEDCYDSSTFSHGNISIRNNSIYNAEDTGIEMWYGEVGYSFDDDGKVTMGSVSIADNTIDTAGYGIYIDYDELGSEKSAVVTLGGLRITGNTLREIARDGIYVDIDGSLGDPTATLNIGRTLILDNFATASTIAPPLSPNGGPGPGSGTAGIWINADIQPDVVFPAPEINGNTVSWFSVGLGLDDLQEASMYCNIVSNNSEFGLFFLSDGNFTATNNTLVDNGLGVKIGDSDTAAVMATGNWWGDAAGPEACVSCNKIDAGSGTVAFDPWLYMPPTLKCGSSPWVMFVPAILSGME